MLCAQRISGIMQVFQLMFETQRTTAGVVVVHRREGLLELGASNACLRAFKMHEVL